MKDKNFPFTKEDIKKLKVKLKPWEKTAVQKAVEVLRNPENHWKIN